ncbi:MAG: metallophosphoesterase [Spirochaetaceae bacterium]|nr:MAG: metallophosphoesterase [Spirochaetaceae bacterium]
MRPIISKCFEIVVLLLLISAPAFALGSGESSECPPKSDAVQATVPIPAPEGQTLRFYALGDTGRADAGQAAVAETMARFQTDFAAAFVLLLGDNFYPRGVRSSGDPQWKSKFEQMYDSSRLLLPFYAVLGNHDYRRNEKAQIEYSRINPQSRWKMPARYYSFSHRLSDGTGIDFFGIDSNTLEDDPSQLTWLESALESSSAEWKIVFTHHVLYNYGHYGNDQKLINGLENSLIRGGVDLYLSGHEHQLQILKSEFGISYMTSGAGSRPRKAGCGENTVYAAGLPGFLAFEIARTQLTTYVVLADRGVDFVYTILK